MFDRKKSVEYAKRWAYGRNPEYYDFTYLGGDCTNFVSQCLYAGGVPMNYGEYGWYYISLDNRAPAWTGVNEFWEFGTRNRAAGLKLKECLKEDLEIADIIQLGSGIRFYHSLLVSKTEQTFSGKKIYVAAHDGNGFDIPLESYGYDYARFAKTGD